VGGATRGDVVIKCSYDMQLCDVVMICSYAVFFSLMRSVISCNRVNPCSVRGSINAACTKSHE